MAQEISVPITEPEGYPEQDQADAEDDPSWAKSCAKGEEAVTLRIVPVKGDPDGLAQVVGGPGWRTRMRGIRD